MSFLKPVPKPVKCECPDPECLGWLVDNIETRQGRFNKADAVIIANRYNLIAMIKAFQGVLVRHQLDNVEKGLFLELTRLRKECSDGL